MFGGIGLEDVMMMMMKLGHHGDGYGKKKKNRTWINKKNSTPHECNIIFSGGGRLHVMSRRAHWLTKIIMTSTQSKIRLHCSALCPFCVSWELFWRCFDASWEKAVVVTLLFFFLFLIIQHKMQSKQSPKHSTAYFLPPPPTSDAIFTALQQLWSA